MMRNNNLSGWNEVKLNELLRVRKGKNQEPIFETQIDNSLPHILVESFDGNYKKFTTSKNGNLCNKNDILIIWDGSRFGLVSTNLEGYVGSTIGILTPSKELNKNYLYYFLKKNYGTIRKTTAGGGIPHLDKAYLLSLKIGMISLKEQEKIANILSSVDNSIKQTQNTIENNQKLKKELLQKLLRNKNNKNYQLKDIFERVTRKNNGQSTNVLTISAQRGLINQELYFNKSVASKTLDNYTLLKKGEFAYNKSYSNGYPMGVIERLDKYGDGVVTTLYICFKLKSSEFSSNFFKQLFYSGILNNEISKIAKEGGRAHGLLNVTSRDFFNIQIHIPKSIQEQEKIANILQTMDKKIELEQKKKQTLEQLKKGLMQELLTGKTRVKVEE